MLRSASVGSCVPGRGSVRREHLFAHGSPGVSSSEVTSSGPDRQILAQLLESCSSQPLRTRLGGLRHPCSDREGRPLLRPYPLYETAAILLYSDRVRSTSLLLCQRVR